LHSGTWLRQGTVELVHLTQAELLE